MRYPVSFLAVALLAAAGASSAASPTGFSACSVDVHTHLDAVRSVGGQPVTDFEGTAETALAIMDGKGIRTAVIMPPPMPSSFRVGYDYGELSAVARKHPGRFAFAGGGGTLSPLLDRYSGTKQVSAEVRKAFEAAALEIARSGAAAFGETTALHLSFEPNHPFIAVPPDHELFLLLADVAARTGLPIDLHMEAVVRDKPLPALLGRRSPNNPATLKANIAAFERLLSHNRKAKIVWAHAGWDNTGDMTVALLRRLLKKHPNLYLNVHYPYPSLFPEHGPSDEGGTPRPEWLKLIKDFPARIMIGSDEFLAPEGSRRHGPPSVNMTWTFVERLPAGLARKLACENPRRVYKLGV